MTALVALVVFIATGIQAWSAATELGRTNRDVVDWWDAEDQLVADEPLSLGLVVEIACALRLRSAHDGHPAAVRPSGA